LARKTLTVLESPWEDDEGEVAEHSMRPFVEGLCALYSWRLIYRTFSTSSELANLVQGEAFDNAPRAVLYVASHGYGGRLQTGVKETREINLASVADNLVKDVEGIWIGACDVGTSKSLQRFLARGGTFWAGGYRCSVDWDSCMLIDIAVLNEVMCGSSARGLRAIVDLFRDVFLRFHPEWLIGDNARGDEVELRDALRLWGRERERGRPEDLTADLIEALEWSDLDESE
jgi:hypothetical protein